MTHSNLSFIGHLEELRWRIIKILFSVFVGGILTYIYSDEIFAILTEPSKSLQIKLNLQVLKVTSMFMVKIGLAIMGGIIFSVPVIIYQLWRFIAPAFEVDHSLNIFLIVLVSTGLFALGFIFGYYVMVPFSLKFFTSLTTNTVAVEYNFTFEGYLQYVTWLMFSAGLVFQLPVVIIAFTKIGFVTPELFRKFRKFAFVMFLILGAILTPPDPLSQILILIPLVILYEVSIILSRIFKKKS